MSIGIVGAGQLGRMMALAGYPLGFDFLFLDRDAKTLSYLNMRRIVADAGFDVLSSSFHFYLPAWLKSFRVIEPHLRRLRGDRYRRWRCLEQPPSRPGPHYLDRNPPMGNHRSQLRAVGITPHPAASERALS